MENNSCNPAGTRIKLNIQNLSLITRANEADILNVALFGLTAKEFREKILIKKEI
jgi:hypothetical protein